VPSGRWTDWLGLAKRAGHLAPGDSQVRRALADNRARLLVVAEDAGRSVMRRYEAWAQDRDVPLVVRGTKLELGVAIGMGPHAVVAVTQKSLARGLLSAIPEATGRNYLGRETREVGQDGTRSRHTGVRAGEGAEGRQPPAHRPAAPPSGREHPQPHEYDRSRRGAAGPRHRAGEAPPRSRAGGPGGERPERGRPAHAGPGGERFEHGRPGPARRGPEDRSGRPDRRAGAGPRRPRDFDSARAPADGHPVPPRSPADRENRIPRGTSAAHGGPATGRSTRDGAFGSAPGADRPSRSRSDASRGRVGPAADGPRPTPRRGSASYGRPSSDGRRAAPGRGGGAPADGPGASDRAGGRRGPSSPRRSAAGRGAGTRSHRTGQGPAQAPRGRRR
jgi:ribosomal protein L7Ae-like RNA K-turn-binding protein